MPVQSYSSGMAVRLGFAVSSSLKPDILIVDEVLAVGDLDFRMKCLERIRRLIDSGTTILLVSHSMVDIQRVCNRVVVMGRGTKQFDGHVGEGIARYELLGISNKGRFENFEILDWTVPRNAVFQKSAVGKFTFSLAGVRNFMDFLV
jgi:ABC-type polysaccharide/polyol phosphate transport system ATPase subunit